MSWTSNAIPVARTLLFILAGYGVGMLAAHSLSVGTSVSQPPYDSIPNEKALHQQPTAPAPALRAPHVDPIEALSQRVLHPARSLSPPDPITDGSIIIAIACAVRSYRDVPLDAQPLLQHLLPSFHSSGCLTTTVGSTPLRFRFYFAYDAGDPVYDSAASRESIATSIRASTHAAASVHFVLSPGTGAPAHAHSAACIAAFLEGAEYVFRVNDDSVLPQRSDWPAVFINRLRAATPIPNFGVVGPDFDFNVVTPVLSHDFTHVTHAIIFGFYYPPSLPNWSSDDWMTYVYEQFGYSAKLPDVRVEHKTREMRYNQDSTEKRQAALTAALADGVTAIDAWTQVHYGITLPHTTKLYTTP